ncbi:MAG: hypothetical protein M3P18_16195, partial [Actinomycetota bacterium]|nr:hypothetical protein [Actinomycetota bacterium]
SAVAADRTSPSGIFSYVVAARAALWAGNLAGAVEALEGLEERNLYGPWIDRSRNTLRAGILALEGSRDEATALFLSASKAWREMEAPFDLALSQLDFVTLIESDDPDRQAAAEEARDIFTKLGAKPFLARLDTAVKAPETTPV